MVSMNHLSAFLEARYENNTQGFHYVSVRSLLIIVEHLFPKNVCSVTVWKQHSLHIDQKIQYNITFEGGVLCLCVSGPET